VAADDVGDVVAVLHRLMTAARSVLVLVVVMLAVVTAPCTRPGSAR